jgi:hypothetical protein
MAKLALCLVLQEVDGGLPSQDLPWQPGHPSQGLPIAPGHPSHPPPMAGGLPTHPIYTPPAGTKPPAPGSSPGAGLWVVAYVPGRGFTWVAVTPGVPEKPQPPTSPEVPTVPVDPAQPDNTLPPSAAPKA